MEELKETEDIQQLAQNLGEMPEPRHHPFLVVVSGLPGTGKSHFCRRLIKDVPALILESDALRKELFSAPDYSAAESARLFRAAHLLIERLLKKWIPVIFDATNLSEYHREYLYSIADRLGARLVLVRVDAPPELVYKRLKERGEWSGDSNSDADWAVYRRMKPRVERIRRRHYAVDTSRDIALVIDKIIREINH